MKLFKFLLPALLVGAFLSYMMSIYLFQAHLIEKYGSNMSNSQNFLAPTYFFVFLSSNFCIFRFTLADKVTLRIKRIIGATQKRLFTEFVLNSLLMCVIWLLIACPLLAVIVFSGKTIVVYSEIVVSVLQFLCFDIYYLLFVKWELGHNEI